MKSQWMIVCGLIFAFLTAIVAVSNMSNVTLNYLFGEVDVSLILVISASVLIGGIIVALFGMKQPQLQKKEIALLKYQIAQIEADNQKLQVELEQVKAKHALLEEDRDKQLHKEAAATSETIEPI